MKVYKVVWSDIDYGNSLEFGPLKTMAISSNYVNPRIEKHTFYATKELATARENELKNAVKVIGNYHIHVSVEEIDVKESL